MFDINIDMHEIEQPQKKRRAPYGSDSGTLRSRRPRLSKTIAGRAGGNESAPKFHSGNSARAGTA